MKNFTLLFVGSCIYVSLHAQHSDTRDTTKYFTQSYFGFTYQQQSFPSLNSRITKYYPRSVPEKSFGLSYGAKTAWDRLLLQGELGMSVGLNGKRNEGRTNILLMYGSFDAGVFLTKGMVRIYPYAGLGMDIVMVSASISNKNIAFDSLFTNPMLRIMTDPVHFTAAYFTWNAGLAIDFGSKKYPNAPYMFGLRAGYRNSFHSSKWSFNSKYGFIDAPSDRLEQWYASIVFYGGMNYMSAKKKK